MGIKISELDPTASPSRDASVPVAHDGQSPRYTIAQILGLLLASDAPSLAPVNSPQLTGTPTAPTAAPGTSTTQIATTAFVAAAISALLDGAPGALDTLNELAAALGDDANFAATVTNALATKAPLALTPNYQSAQTAFTNSSTHTFAHGLGRVPNSVEVWAVCVSAQSGIADVGEWVLVGGPGANSTNTYGAQVRKSTINVGVHIGDTGLWGISNATGGFTSLIPANFRLVVLAW